MVGFIRMIMLFTFMALLSCPFAQADEEEVIGFDFTREFEEEQARAQQEKEQQGAQTKEQMETKYLRSLEKLINFDRIIKQDGFSFATTEKIAQQNLQLQNLLDSSSRRANRRADYSREQRLLVVDERFQQILGSYINSVNTTINFMRRVSTAHQQLKSSIDVFNGKVGAVAEQLNEERGSLILVTLEGWDKQAHKFVTQYNRGSSTTIYQDIYRFAVAAFSDAGLKGYSAALFSRDGHYLTSGRFSPATSSRIRVADGLRNTLVEKKGEFTEMDAHFKTILEQWRKFSVWLAEQNKLVPAGTWKLAGEMIGVSADEMYNCLNGHYAEYQKNYKTTYVDGPINNVLYPHQNKDQFQKELEDVWKQMRADIEKAFEHYQRGVAAVQRIRGERQ